MYIYLNFYPIKFKLLFGKTNWKIKVKEYNAPHKPLVKGSMPIFPKAFQVVATINTFWHILWSLNSVYLQHNSKVMTFSKYVGGHLCLDAKRASNIPVTRIWRSARSVKILATWSLRPETHNEEWKITMLTADLIWKFSFQNITTSTSESYPTRWVWLHVSADVIRLSKITYVNWWTCILLPHIQWWTRPWEINASKNH